MKNFIYKKNQPVFTIIFITIFMICAIFMLSCSNINNRSLSEDSLATSTQENVSTQDENTKQSDQLKNEVISLGVDDVFNMLKDKDKYFLLDVRTPEEYEEGFIENSVLIPLAELESRISEIPGDKPIIVYCRSGNRSAQAAGILIKNNFNEVYNMMGGITEWVKRGYPLIK